MSLLRFIHTITGQLKKIRITFIGVVTVLTFSSRSSD